ncbi:MAG: hypothetical protein U0822_25160 [Anaerolineae bacterium]
MRYDDPDWQNRMRVRLDTNLAWADRVGPRGIPADALAPLTFVLSDAVGAGFKRAPTTAAATRNAPESPGDVTDFARWAGRHYDSLVVLAEGSLGEGMATLAAALLHPHWNLLPQDARVGPRLFFVDTTDPEVVSGVLDVLDPAAALFLVVDAAGNAPGPLAEFLVFRRALMTVLNEKYREHIVGLGGPSADVLRVLGRQEGFPVFDLPDSGSTILHPAALAPLSAAGVDSAELLAGADFARALSAEANPWRNPALMAAVLHWLIGGEGAWAAVVPQAAALVPIGRWLEAQRRRRVAGRGHGIADVVADGEPPLAEAGRGLVDFIAVGEYRREAPVPELRTRSALPTPEARAARDQVVAGLGYLGGTLLSELRHAEGRASALALAEAGQPSLTYRLPEINPFTVGQLVALWELQVAYAAALTGRAADDASVDTVREAASALANRPGLEERRRALLAEEARARDDRIV